MRRVDEEGLRFTVICLDNLVRQSMIMLRQKITVLIYNCVRGLAVRCVSKRLEFIQSS